MNTGTVSTDVASPTIITLPTGWAVVSIIAGAGNAGTLVYNADVTVLNASNDSTLTAGQTGAVKNPNGVTKLAFASSGGAASADIQLVQRKS